MRKPFASLFDNWFRPKYSIKYLEDVPVVFEPLIIYVIGLKTAPWQAAFICPCGCGDLIQLNLLKEANPRWKVYMQKRKITIYPSVYRKVGCKSHFYISKGNVRWAYDD